MHAHLRTLIDRFAKEGRPNLHKNISITWIYYNNNNPKIKSGLGAAWEENKLFYPASIVKLIYGIAIEVWLQKDFILDSHELRRALAHMIADSSNDATSYIVDILTGTNSGPSLKGNKWEAWKTQRQLVNKWLRSLNWPELTQVNCCQKTWTDSPYGRDKEFYGEHNANRNSLSTSATARMFEALMTDNLLSPQRSKFLKQYFLRSLDVFDRKRNPENQIDGFLGEGLPSSSKVWSKAGWMSEVRHDITWSHNQEGHTMLLVVFLKGTDLSKDTFLLPALASELNKYHLQISF